MIVRFWGVRGSIPTPGPTTVVYGGNTACVSVEAGDRTLIFDAGSGIRPCGNYLLGKGGPVNARIFISHTHWDHIQGFPFFVPAYLPGNAIDLYGPPSAVRDKSLEAIMEMQSSYEYFPVHISQLAARIRYFDCREGPLDIPGLEMHACLLNHPVTCLAYKIVHNGKTFVYGGDHEPFSNIYRDADGGGALDEDMLRELDANAEEQNQKVVDFCRDADLVSWDAQYSDQEYPEKKGWGHGSYGAGLELAARAGVKRICLNHHDPMSDDQKLARAEEQCKALAEGRGVELDFAREGLVIDL